MAFINLENPIPSYVADNEKIPVNPKKPCTQCTVSSPLKYLLSSNYN